MTAKNVKKITEEMVMALVEKKKGNATNIAKALKCSRQTVIARMNESEELKQAFVDAREARIDWAESKLDTRINAGDITAIIFFLKTQGKSRGYVERQETDHMTGGESLDKALGEAISKIYGDK